MLNPTFSIRNFPLTKLEMDRLQRIIQSDPANKICIDCGAPHPQWASVNNGVFFCLECSGQHRSLGVQTSFVRSVTMDRWTDDQLRKMELGGNSNALAFWKGRPGYRDGMDIRTKYHSEFARLYREKLAAEFEGRPFEAKPAGTFTVQAKNGSTRLASPSFSQCSSMSTGTSSYSTTSSGASPTFVASPDSIRSGSSSSTGNSRSSIGSQSITNAPGGEEDEEDWFSKFKGYAKNISGQLNDSFIQPAASAVKNSQLTKKAVEYIKNVPSKAQNIATERWNNDSRNNRPNPEEDSKKQEPSEHEDENWSW